MRILVLGAGATGGYFGGRLLASGADVTFLVREKRASELADQGLKIESPFGNLAVKPRAVTNAPDFGAADCIILSCKAYDLDGAIAAIRPAVGPATLVLPLLNGIKHLDALDAAFGKKRVLGGSCHLSVALMEDCGIRHFNQLHLLTFGPRMPAQTAICGTLFAIFSKANFETRMRDDIEQAMWDKWVLLASLAALTCLFRASVGEICATGEGRRLMLETIEEARAIAKVAGHEPDLPHMETIRTLLTDPKSPVVASMLRDMQKGARIEVDLIVGDLLRRGRQAGLATPLLETAFVNLEAYENRIAAG